MVSMIELCNTQICFMVQLAAQVAEQLPAVSQTSLKGVTGDGNKCVYRLTNGKKYC